MASEETTNWYERMQFATPAGYGTSPALLVIDFQKGLTVPGKLFYGYHDDQIEATNRISAVMREKGYPVIFTTVAYDDAEILNDCYQFLRKLPALKKQLRTGTENVEIDDRLAPRRDEFVIVKKFQSAFIGTPLSTILTGLKVDTLIVTGCATSGCLKGTVMDACAQGYYVILPEEGIGDFTKEVHEANLFDMNAKNGDAVHTQDVLKYLQGLPDSPRAARRAQMAGV